MKVELSVRLQHDSLDEANEKRSNVPRGKSHRLEPHCICARLIVSGMTPDEMIFFCRLPHRKKCREEILEKKSLFARHDMEEMSCKEQKGCKCEEKRSDGGERKKERKKKRRLHTIHLLPNTPCVIENDNNAARASLYRRSQTHVSPALT